MYPPQGNPPNEFDAGDALLASADNEGNSTTTTFTKRKEIKINKAGTLRIKFDGRSLANGASWQFRGYVARNGVQVGTLQVNPTTAYVTFSEDIGGWSAGDLVQLYVAASISNTAVYWRNFRIYVDSTEAFTVNQN